MSLDDESRFVGTWNSSSVSSSISWLDRILANQTVGRVLLSWLRASVLYLWATADLGEQTSLHVRDIRLFPTWVRTAVMSSNVASPILQRQRIRDMLMVALVVSLPLGSYELSIFSLPDVLTLLTVAVLGLETIRNGAIQRSLAAFLAVAAIAGMLAWMAVSVAVTGASVRSLTQPFGHWLLLCAVVLYVKDVRDTRRILMAAAGAAIGIAILTILATVVQIPTARILRPRSFGPIQMPVGRASGLPLAFGILGMFMLYPVPYLGIRGWRTRSPHMLGGVGAIVLAVIITQSRSTYLALAVTSGILIAAGASWIIFFGSPRWRQRVGLGVVLGSLLSVPLFLAGARILIAAGRRTFVVRIMQIREGLLLILDRPLFGTGPGQFREIAGIRYVIHTAVVRLGTEVGLPALAAFLVATYLGFRQLVRTATGTKYSPLAIAILAGGAAVAVEASLQGSFGRPTWIVLGLAVTAPWGDSDAQPD